MVNQLPGSTRRQKFGNAAEECIIAFSEGNLNQILSDGMLDEKNPPNWDLLRDVKDKLVEKIKESGDEDCAAAVENWFTVEMQHEKATVQEEQTNVYRMITSALSQRT